MYLSGKLERNNIFWLISTLLSSRQSCLQLTMVKLCFVFTIFPILVNAVIYIERHELDFNRKYGNWTVSYFHDESHNAVVNLTMKVFSTITKLLLYFEVKMAEDRNDNEYRRQFIKTVIDVEKCFKGMQSSIFLKAYVEELNRYMNFNLTFPLAPVSRKAASRTVFLNWCVVRDGRCFS